jgi:catechol 2,3-dioxygenase-like lactoylglutathione lyase family enzyme
VEVAARDARQARRGNPAEELPAVEELEPVSSSGQARIAGKATGQPRRVRRLLPVERMRGHDSRAGGRSRLDRSLDPRVDGYGLAQAERERVRRVRRIEVVIRQLEPWDDDEAVRAKSPRSLELQLGKVRIVPLERQCVRARRLVGEPWVVGADDVIGDAEDVEARQAVEIDELANGERSVAPRRVCVQLGEEGCRASSEHGLSMPLASDEKWLICRKEPEKSADASRLHAVTATGFNHVSIRARELERSVRFYEDVFGMERIPTYDFDAPTQYLRVGELQLHVFERGDPEQPAPLHQHVALDVDDFEGVFERARALGILDDTFGDPVVELPDGSVQLYLRDPAGNLIEVNWPDVATLDHSVVRPIRRHVERIEQSEEGLRASLYLDRPALRSVH